MNEADADALVATLVTEFERTKLGALEARGEYLARCGQVCIERARSTLEYSRWQALEAHCREILNRIDELAERNAAA